MRPPLAVFGALRRTLPAFNAAETFVCRKSVHNQAQTGYKSGYKSIRQTPFLNAFRSRAAPARQQSTTAPSASPLSELSRSIGQQTSAPAKQTSFPEVTDKKVGYWLLGSAVSVFGIVIFGGLTRLTESGLSITEWRPVTGSLPPMNAEKWESEFALYRASPEFKLLNPRMTMEEFKQIYWMEWIHRLWGRFIGITFLLPTAYFIARRRVSAGMAFKLTGICGLIGFQGVIGWWMVASGLKDDLFAPGSHPRVSQYRLTAHLGTAFICYLAMFWNALTIFRENRLLANPQESSKILKQMMVPELKFFRRSVGALLVLVFATAMSGGLVAGLDAGLIYNEFPYMGLGLTPPKKELFDTFYSHVPDHSDLWWRNILENPSLVQLDHRIMATTTFTAVMALWAYTRFNPRVRALMTPAASKGMRGVVHLVWLQVALGISTLLYLVPVPLASAHQAGALALLTGTMALGSRVWFPKRAAKLVAQRLAAGAPRPSAIGKRGPGAMLAARTGMPARA
ncbi:cytochrome c oxidase assembly protein-like protein cox15 [Aureobasidium pullulans]|uniref:Cytochrome c oxidase assembly protein-like protein cox15 n=1 Tax=Aureobasidium pullulans TaxID=5580 RepID=A0A4S9K6I5_AURPU|nr:cytochrome c oxidase assembly protein-like protein cox15 [Aureobasidium pullulans]